MEGQVKETCRMMPERGAVMEIGQNRGSEMERRTGGALTGHTLTQ